MADHDANPMPDELLLDLVEGTLRADQIEQVRAALRADPTLAARLEAMRQDRRALAALGSVEKAPVGLVRDAIDAGERSALLEERRPVRTRHRFGARARVAASLGLAALVGVGVVMLIDEQRDPVVDPAIIDPTSESVATRPIDPDVVTDSRSGFEESVRTFEGVEDRFATTGPGRFIERSASSAGLVAVDERSPAGEAEPTPRATSSARLSMTDESAEGDTPAAPIVEAPEPTIPLEVASWAREGRLIVLIEPPGEPTDGARLPEERLYRRSVARSLRLAYDPLMQSGWGLTSLPTDALGGVASNTPERPEGPGVAGQSTRDIVVTLGIDRASSDEQLLETISGMARSIRTLTDQRITLARLETARPSQAGLPALTVDNLLWWRRAPDRWSPITTYRVPVIVRRNAED